MIMRRSRNFCWGGGGGGASGPSGIKKSSDNVFFYFFLFFSPQLILQNSSGYFQRKLSFSTVPVGMDIFPDGGGGPIACSL